MASSDIEIVDYKPARPVLAPVAASASKPVAKKAAPVKEKTKPKQQRKRIVEPEAEWTKQDRSALIFYLHEWFIEFSTDHSQAIGVEACRYASERIAHDLEPGVRHASTRPTNKHSQKGCKAEWMKIKKDWRAHERLRNSSGMGWNESLKMCVVPRNLYDDEEMPEWANKPWHREIDYETMEELCMYRPRFRF